MENKNEMEQEINELKERLLRVESKLQRKSRLPIILGFVLGFIIIFILLFVLIGITQFISYSSI